MKIFIDGVFYNHKDAKISILDHGFLYGNGAFTTITTYKQKILFLSHHIERLFESAEIINIKPRWEKKQVEEWTNQAYELNRFELTDARIRINISRGVGPDINIEGSDKCIPSISIIVSKLPNHSKNSFNEGISMLTVSIERVFPKSKNFNFLPSIVALKEARLKGYYDALFVDQQGYITEATTGNLFFFKDGTLHTTSSKILEGITRMHIIKVAQQNGIRVIKKMFTLGEILNADEVFISGTTKMILPVSKINDKPIGNIKYNLMTKKLNELFLNYVNQNIN